MLDHSSAFLLFGQMVLQVICELIDGRLFGENLDGSILRDFLNTEALADAFKQLKCLGCLLLGQQIDLQRQLLTLLGSFTFTVLLHQHKCGKENGLNRYSHAEEDKGIRVKWRHGRYDLAIHQEPKGEHSQVEYDERHTSGKSADGIA